jgi:hypothetical protein
MPEASIRQAVNLSEDWMVLVFLFALFSLAYTRRVHPARILRLWNSIWNIRVMRQTIREEPNTPRANLLFNTVFYTLAGLVAYVSIKCYRPDIAEQQGALLYPALVLSVLAIYTIKRLTLRAITFISDGDFSLNEYEYSVFLTNRMLGLVLLPIALFVVYFPIYQAKALIGISIFLVFAMLCYRIIRSVLTAIESGVTPFYILFYICTLEILPSALGIKWLVTI